MKKYVLFFIYLSLLCLVHDLLEGDANWFTFSLKYAGVEIFANQ